jgi:DNA polymerase-3 subunit delta
MVSVRHSEADRFIAQPDRSICVYLVFGSDNGLISERARTLAHASVTDPNDPFQLIRLDAETLAADPIRLVDEANTVPLFGGRRAIWVEAGSKSFAAAVETLLAAPPPHCALIIEAGPLKRDAALRKMIEKSRVGAAIECYPDDVAGLGRLIERAVAAVGATISGEAKQVLIASLGSDRLSTRSELEKLLLYAHGSKQIRLKDVEAIVTDASALSLEAAIDGAFLSDLKAVDATASRVYAEGGDPAQLLSAALRHAVVVHRARLELDRGATILEAIEAVAPRLFFKRKPALEQQLRLWNEIRLGRAIAILADAIGRARREHRLAEIIAVRALWSVAQIARSRP